MKHFALLLLLAATLSSCGIYRPNVVNVPLMQEKGELHIGAYVGGPEVQLSYAATDNIAFMANYTNTGHTRNDEGTDDYSEYQHYFGEIGIGLFKNSSSLSTFTLQEVFLLAGIGHTSRFSEFTDLANRKFTNYDGGSYSRFCAQVDFGKKVRSDVKVIGDLKLIGDFSYALSPRIMFIHYYNVYNNQRDDFKDLAGSYIYLDATLTIQYHIFKYITISTQISATYPATAKGGYNHYYEFAPLLANIGIVANFDLF